MGDNNHKKSSRDDHKINPDDHNDVLQAASRFGVTPTAIQQAIKVVGNSWAAIKKYLSR